MLRLLSILCCLIIAYPIVSAQALPDWKSYSGQVNEAELSIIDENYKQALAAYNNAFSLTVIPHSRDLYNAICCTKYTGDTNLAFDFAGQLVKKGCDTAFFASTIFDFMRNSDKWQEFQAQFPSLRNRYLATVNIKLKKEITDMLEADQYYRKLEKNKTKGSTEQLLYKDSIQLTDSLHYLRILELFQQSGYPGEETVGVFLTEDGELLQKNDLSIVLLHLVQKGKLDLTDYLMEGVQKGRLRPEEFANYHEFVYNLKKDSSAFYLRNPVIQIDQDYYKVTHSDRPGMIELFNRNRARIGMASVQEEQKKIIFQLQHKETEFLLQPYMSLARISPPAEQKEKMLTSFEKIE